MSSKRIAVVVAALAMSASGACPGDADLRPLVKAADAGPPDASESTACGQREGAACFVGIGACQRVGVYRCVDGALFCDGVPGVPSPELCETNLDEDCDGEADEAPIGGCCVDADCGSAETCRVDASAALVGGRCTADAVVGGDAAVEDPSAPDPPDAGADAAVNEPPVPDPEPQCGNRLLEPGERCEVGVGGATDFDCSPDCELRSIYGQCAEPLPVGESSDCSADEECVLLFPALVCLPVRSGPDACPDLPGYTQALGEGGRCVITCESERDCPQELPYLSLCNASSITGDSGAKICGS